MPLMWPVLVLPNWSAPWIAEKKPTPGESIWTESSYKFDRYQLATLGAAAGLALSQMWIDEDALFALAAYDAA